MEDVNLSFSARTNSAFIRADIDTFTDGTLSRKGKKHCKTQYKINIFHIHTIKLQLASGEPPASALYIYTYECYAVISCNPFPLPSLRRSPPQGRSLCQGLSCFHGESLHVARIHERQFLLSLSTLSSYSWGHAQFPRCYLTI